MLFMSCLVRSMRLGGLMSDALHVTLLHLHLRPCMHACALINNITYTIYTYGICLKSTTISLENVTWIIYIITLKMSLSSPTAASCYAIDYVWIPFLEASYLHFPYKCNRLFFYSCQLNSHHKKWFKWHFQVYVK